MSAFLDRLAAKALFSWFEALEVAAPALPLSASFLVYSFRPVPEYA
jgi:hypothetical protein